MLEANYHESTISKKKMPFNRMIKKKGCQHTQTQAYFTGKKRLIYTLKVNQSHI